MNLHELLHFIAAILVATFWIWGIHCVFATIFKGAATRINAWLTQLFNNNARSARYVLKPLIWCPPCMASVHGAFMFWVIFWHSGTIGALWIFPFMICLCGLNFIIKEALYPMEE